MWGEIRFLGIVGFPRTTLFVVIVFEKESTMIPINSGLVNPGVCFMDEINIVRLD